MKPIVSLCLTLSVLLILASPASQAQRTVSTITLQQADPALLIRAIEPQLSTGSSISHYQNQLVINATAAELATIRQLVKQLEGSGRQLVFTLRREGNIQAASSKARVTGSVGDDDLRISTGKQGVQTTTRNTVTIQQRSYKGSSVGTQGVRATEGSPAYIAAGSSVPIRQSTTAANGVSSGNWQAADISSGFYATAWLDRDVVTVDIDQRDNHYQQGNISTQQLQTRVSGKLGSWIPIGVVLESQQYQSSELNSRANAAGDDFVRLYLKIELVN
jgi:hypothetical protein